MQKILLVLMLFCCMVIARAGAAVLVMPEQYAFVVSENGDWGNWEQDSFGDEDKWNKIILWGRCPDGNIGDEYRWIYGNDLDEDDIVDETNWNWITSSNYRTLNSGSHQYATNPGEPITYYTARLQIRDGVL